MAVTRVVLPAVLTLAGALGAAAPALAAPSSLTPDQALLAFADHDVHDGGHQSLTVTFTNSSGTDVQVAGAAVAGADASQFPVSSDQCSGQLLSGAGGTCTVNVDFAPTTPGAKAATLSLTDDGGTVDVPLQGTGATGTLTATPVSFPRQPWFYGDPSAQLTLTDASSWQLQSTSWAFTGPDAARFYVQWGDNCFHQGFGPGSTCNAGIGMRASDPGTYQAQLEVSNDGTQSPLVVPLSVTVLNGPHLVADTRQVAFGQVAVGQEASRAITVTNDGDFGLQVQQAVMLTGLPDTLYTSDDGCSLQVLAPSDSCRLTVHFAPSAPGPVNAPLLIIPGNSPQGLLLVGVNGSGAAAALSGPPAAAAPADPPAGGSSPLTPLSAPASEPLAPRGAAVLSGSPVVARTLRCRAVGYSRDTALSYTWRRNGIAVTTAASARLRLEAADVGARFACLVRARNGAGIQVAASRYSAPVRARNPVTYASRRTPARA